VCEFLAPAWKLRRAAVVLIDSGAGAGSWCWCRCLTMGRLATTAAGHACLGWSASNALRPPALVVVAAAVAAAAIVTQRRRCQRQCGPAATADRGDGGGRALLLPRWTGRAGNGAHCLPSPWVMSCWGSRWLAGPPLGEQEREDAPSLQPQPRHDARYRHRPPGIHLHLIAVHSASFPGCLHNFCCSRGAASSAVRRDADVRGASRLEP
jgi:hypothetical protein